MHRKIISRKNIKKILDISKGIRVFESPYYVFGNLSVLFIYSEVLDLSNFENDICFKGMDYVDQDEDDLDEGPEIEMNWNLATYLPEGGAIQKNFNTVIAGYITANYQFIEEEAQRIAPGHTPIRKRRSSQSQTPNRRLSQATGEIFVLKLIHN